MAVELHSLNDYLAKNSELVRGYFNKVIKIFKSFQLTSDNGDWVLFGGFIRDIIAGINYVDLITKDVDMYFLYKDGCCPKKHADKAAYAILNKLLKIEGVEVLNYNKVCYEKQPFTEYAIVKIEYDGIIFDIGFDCGSRRFNNNFDYRCNSLYCRLDDLILQQRLKLHSLIDPNELSVDKCIDDIINKRLILVVGLLKQPARHFEYIQNIKYRKEKMLFYGYQDNETNKQVITEIYTSYLNEVKTQIVRNSEHMHNYKLILLAKIANLTSLHQEKKAIRQIKPNEDNPFDDAISLLEQKEDIVLRELNDTIDMTYSINSNKFTNVKLIELAESLI